MKLFLLCYLSIISLSAYSQRKGLKIYNKWEKSVINIETESSIYTQHYIDSLYRSKKDLYNKNQMDSLIKVLSLSNITTGTALYIKFNNRKYLVTAKHVINNSILVDQKLYENEHKINHWDTLEAIAQRISIRTPFAFFINRFSYNAIGITNNNFIHSPPPFFFISDSTGDGIGVISLQDNNYKNLDTVLQKDGYRPLNITRTLSNKEIKVLDNVYAIGFPEMVSIVYKLLVPSNVILPQLPEIVKPFIVKGTVAMYEKKIQHFYVDMTITPGNSGSPIIKNGKLIGIVSGINKYHIIKEENNIDGTTNLFGIGHLVNIINVSQLKENLEKYQTTENLLIALQKH